MALILAMTRKLPEACHNQPKKAWRGMIGDISRREDELGAKTLLIVGLGRIGTRLARLAKAFDLRVIGIRKHPAVGGEGVDAVHGVEDLSRLLPSADFLALTCPLTRETENLINADALRQMSTTSYLINVARGRVVDEAALVDALRGQRIAGAAIDVTVEEPLPPTSPLWDLPNVLITPHTAGETRRYEDNLLDILDENLDRLWRQDMPLKNQIV
jgi:phosphoglycerate dehydrogenase-like enzyme